MSSPDHRKPLSPSFATLVQSFFAEHLTVDSTRQVSQFANQI